MLAALAYTEGSPGPTLVLESSGLPRQEPRLLAALAEARRWLSRRDAEPLKIALIRPSEHPLFDLDYRFVQALPEGPDRFDTRGTCGHSILGAVLTAARRGWLPPLAPGARIRVNALNTDVRVVCEIDGTGPRSVRCTVHFLPEAPAPFASLLPAGDPVCELRYPGGAIEASLVTGGNPYVFVDARRLDLHDRAALLTRDGLFAELQAIRRAAALRLGLSAAGVFPKIAVIGVHDPGRLAARAISVPGWHPTLALSGLVTLAVAAAIPGTIPNRLAAEAGCPPGALLVDTPGGVQEVSAAISGGPGDERLAWVSVPGKQAVFRGEFFVEPLRRLPVAQEEPCLVLPC